MNNEQIKELILKFLTSVERHKDTFTWNASLVSEEQRKSREFTNTYNFVFEGDTFCITESLTTSHTKYFYKKIILINGENKTLRAITDVLKKLKNK